MDDNTTHNIIDGEIHEELEIDEVDETICCTKITTNEQPNSLEHFTQEMIFQQVANSEHYGRGKRQRSQLSYTEFARSHVPPQKRIFRQC